MYELEKDLAWVDQLSQSFTSEDVEEIKSAINVPRANVTILNTVYSPEETKIGVWREYRTVEGQQVLMEKPVYGKTITKASASAGVIGSISNIERIIIFYGVCTTGGSYKRALPWADSTGNTINIYVDNNGFQLALSGVFTSSQPVTNLSMTVHYTKTTDEWQEVVE